MNTRDLDWRYTRRYSMANMLLDYILWSRELCWVYPSQHEKWKKIALRIAATLWKVAILLKLNFASIANQFRYIKGLSLKLSRKIPDEVSQQNRNTHCSTIFCCSMLWILSAGTSNFDDVRNAALNFIEVHFLCWTCCRTFGWEI